MAEDVFGRTPFGSIIAAVLVCLGVGLYCGALHRALEITIIGIFDNLFFFRVTWLETIQIMFIVLAVVMGLLSIMFLVFGILATGATRQNIYSGAKCIMGGRISALFFLVLSYICNLVWVSMTSLLAMPVIIFAMLWSVCVWEIEEEPEWYLDNYCLNLSRFGVYRNYTEGVDKNAICGGTDLDTFCKHVKDAEPMYILAFSGSLLIVLGLVAFIMALTVNYNKIVTTKEMTDLRFAVDIDTEDSMILSNTRGNTTALSQSAFAGASSHYSSRY